VSQRLRAKRKGVDLATPSAHRQAMAAAPPLSAGRASGFQRACFDLGFDLGFGFDGLAFGGVIMALIIAVWAADWLRRAADIAAAVHIPPARLAQDSHALMKGFLAMVQATPDLGDDDDNSAGRPMLHRTILRHPPAQIFGEPAGFWAGMGGPGSPVRRKTPLPPQGKRALFCWHIHCLCSPRGRAAWGERAGWVRSATP